MDETQHKAMRTAGILYMLIAVTAPLGLLYVPGEIVVAGDAAATAENIRNSEWLLRLGIGSELLHQAIAVFLVLALYRLFKPVNENQARLLVALGALVSVPIMFLNILNEIAAIVLVSRADFLAVFQPGQPEALALLFLGLHEQGIIVASVFWGLWLFPFGALVIRSGFIPRIFGYLLFIAGTGYLASSFASLVAPAYGHIVGQVALILEVAEVPIIFWLFFKGLRPPAKGDA